MNPSLDQILIDVWRQALVENAEVVVLGIERYPIRLTPKLRLREVDFVFEGNTIRGLEQNPATKSRWAQMARSGMKVMQFLEAGRYIANVADGKVTLYGPREGNLVQHVRRIRTVPGWHGPTIRKTTDRFEGL
jgi:hypothetical protein